MKDEIPNADLDGMTPAQLVKEWKRADLRAQLASLESEENDVADDPAWRALDARRDAIFGLLCEARGADPKGLAGMCEILSKRIEVFEPDDPELAMLEAIRLGLLRIDDKINRTMKAA